MSASALPRVPRALRHPEAVLAPMGLAGEVWGIFLGADRRRRPAVRMPTAQVEALAAAGLIVPWGAEAFRLAADAPAVPAPSHRPEIRVGEPALDCLERIAAPEGLSWFGGREIAAARRLYAAWPEARPAVDDMPEDARVALTAFCDEGDLSRAERVRRWPAGAGRLALKLALGILAARA